MIIYGKRKFRLPKSSRRRFRRRLRKWPMGYWPDGVARLLLKRRWPKPMV